MDRYSKIILTIIAVCLVWICLRDTVPASYAQSPNPLVQRVIITGIDDLDRFQPIPVKIVAFDHQDDSSSPSGKKLPWDAIIVAK